MVNANKIIGKTYENGLYLKDLAKMLDIQPKTLSEKLKSGIFKSNEIEVMARIFNVETDAEFMSIFFSKEVSRKETSK